jgi:hypothetical protein
MKPGIWTPSHSNPCDPDRLLPWANLIVLHPYGGCGFDHKLPDQDDRYLCHVASRLAPFANVWWSTANGYGQMPNKSPADGDRNIRTVAQTDPHGHLPGIRNGFPFYDHGHPAITQGPRPVAPPGANRNNAPDRVSVDHDFRHVPPSKRHRRSRLPRVIAPR